jgi:hypothetical protein
VTSYVNSSVIGEAPTADRIKRFRPKIVIATSGTAASLAAVCHGLAITCSPQKWPFGTTAACSASDFVVYAGTAGSSNQTTLVSYDDLYSGCGGTVPSVDWQYNMGSGAVSIFSPVLPRCTVCDAKKQV